MPTATKKERPLSPRDLARIQRALRKSKDWGRAQMRRRVLENLKPRALGMDCHDPAWLDFLPGIKCRILRARRDGMVSMLWLVAAGAGLAPHRHEHADECLVLRGALRVGSDLELGVGDYLLGRRGEWHPEITSPEGALVYIHAHAPRLATMTLGEIEA